MVPNCELCCLSLPYFYWNSNDTFYCLTQDRSYVLSTISAHFGITFAYFWVWIPRNKPNKYSTAALVSKASDWSGRCQRGLGNIYISVSFLSAFSFWKFQPKLYWIFNFDPYAFLPTGYRKRAKTILFGACSDIRKWLLNSLHFTLSWT